MCEDLIASHQPDRRGNCRACAIDGAMIRYPCQTLLFVEHAIERLDRRNITAVSPPTGPPNFDHEGVHMEESDLHDGWRTSSFSGESGNCVEVKSVGGAFAVRDSKSANGPVLVFSAAEWTAFTTGVRAGEFDE
jgi:hypothetical protein